MPMVSLWSREDGVLGAVGPIALAAAARTALMVDLDRRGPNYPGPSSLASLVADGPRRADLAPTRPGVCLLRNGGVSAADAAEVLEALVAGWPNVVLRLAPSMPPPDTAVCVATLVPGTMLAPSGRRLVLQSAGWRVQAPRGAIVLPRPSRSTLYRLLTGVAPLRADRWVRAWGSVWREPWT